MTRGSQKRKSVICWPLSEKLNWWIMPLHAGTCFTRVNRVVSPASNSLELEYVSSVSRPHGTTDGVTQNNKFISAGRRSSSKCSDEVGTHFKELENLVIVSSLISVRWHIHVIWITNKLTTNVSVMILNKKCDVCTVICRQIGACSKNAINIICHNLQRFSNARIKNIATISNCWSHRTTRIL